MGALWGHFGLDFDFLGRSLELGDNFVVNAVEDNDEGVDLYIPMCTKTPFTCMKCFMYEWGEQFNPGNLVVTGSTTTIMFVTSSNVERFGNMSPAAQIHSQNGLDDVII